MRSTFLILSAVLTGPVVAQGLVAPSQFANTEAPSATAGLTAVRDICVQQIHDGVPPRAINGIALRRDGAAGGMFAAMSVIYDIQISSTSVTAATATATFATNHGQNKDLVALNRQGSFPQTESGAAPSPFLFRLPFTKSFHHTGGPLCVEIRLRSASPSGVPLDVATGAASNPQPFMNQWGAGCRYATGVPRIALGPNGSANWNAQPAQLRWGYGGSYLPPNSFASLVIGFTTANIGGAPLPFELPGSAGGPSGPCTLYTDVVIAVPVPVDGGGNFTFTSTIVPLLTVYQGQSWFAQAVAVEPGANSLGVALSNVVQHHVVAPFGSVGVSSVQAAPCAPTGSLRLNYGMVMELL